MNKLNPMQVNGIGKTELELRDELNFCCVES